MNYDFFFRNTLAADPQRIRLIGDRIPHTTRVYAIIAIIAIIVK